MKKLSKVSAFLLACAMSLSMGASAATVVDAQFTDIDKATNADSLSMLASLNVMNGYTDGTIRPLGEITRAEIAKMIYVIKMGGKDDGAAYYKSVKTNLTDIDGHWAEGYIKYCFSTGIVAGRDDNKFDPDANVTGVELAKMLLVIQGYNAQKSGLVGAGWSNKVVELGAENEYFKGYNTLLNASATREGAATIMVNALDATLVTWSEDANDYVESESNKKTQTLGKRYFGLTTYEGTLLSVGEYEIDGTTKSGKDKISMEAEKKDDDSITKSVESFDFEADATDLLGQYVKVSVDGKGKVYGIYAVSGKNGVLDTTVDQVVVSTDRDGNAEDKIKVDGETYKLDKTTVVYTTGDGTQQGKIQDYFKTDETFDASSVRFIDNTGDGKIDIALINPILAVRKVTSASSTGFTADESVKYEDIVYDKAFSKGDYVVKTKDFFSGDYRYELATVVEGEVTSNATEDRDGNKIGAVEIDDDAWYTAYDSNRVKNVKVDSSNGIGDLGKNTTLNGKQKLVVVGNIIYFSETLTTGASDIAYVAEAGAVQTSSICRMKLVFADGSTSTVNCAADTPYPSVAACQTAFDAMAGKLVAYEVNDDGDYELTVISDDQTAKDSGYGSYADGVSYVENASRLGSSAGNLIIDRTAVVFVEYKDGTKTKWTVISGEDVLNFSKNFGANGFALREKDGVKAATVVVLKSDDTMPGSEDGKGLAVIVKNATTMTKIGSQQYYKVSVWTADGEDTLYILKSNYENSSLKLGSSFTYNLDANSDYKIAKEITTLNKTAIYYVDGTKSVAVSDDGTVANSGSYKLASDVVILNVETKSNKITGVSDDSIYEADEDGENYKLNAFYLVDDGNDEVTHIVVDVNGKWQLN